MATCHVMYYFCTIGGFIAFLVTGAVYSARLLTSHRDANIATYNSMVRQWAWYDGYQAFSNLPTTYVANMNATGASSDVVIAATAVTGVSDSPAIPPQVDVLTYNDAYRVHYSGNQGSFNFLEPLAWNGQRLQVSLNITLPHGEELRVLAPVAFPFDFPKTCTSTKYTTTCYCTTGTEESETCRVWLSLNGVCLVLDATSLTPAINYKPGPGCAPIPTPADQMVVIPQLDSCVPMTVNGLSMLSYHLYESQPSTLEFTVFNVNVRSAEDPYVDALAITGGTLEFGDTTLFLATLSAAMWGMTCVCLFMWLLLLFCTVSSFFDAPLARLESNSDTVVPAWKWPLQLTVDFFADTVPALRRCKCRGCSRSCCSGTAAVLVPAYWLAFSYAAFVALSIVAVASPWAAAYREVCGGFQIYLQSGKLAAIAASSPEGKTYAIMSIMGLSLLGGVMVVVPLMVLACGCCGKRLCRRVYEYYDEQSTFVQWGVPFAIMYSFGLCLYTAAVAQWFTYRAVIQEAYCTSITDEYLIPSYCTSESIHERCLIAAFVVLMPTLVVFSCLAALGRRGLL